jgi:hypothetical protein
MSVGLHGVFETAQGLRSARYNFRHSRATLVWLLSADGSTRGVLEPDGAPFARAVARLVLEYNANQVRHQNDESPA